MGLREFREVDWSFIDTPVAVNSLSGTDWSFSWTMRWDGTLYENQVFHTIFGEVLEDDTPTFGITVNNSTEDIRLTLGGTTSGVDSTTFSVAGINDGARHTFLLEWDDSENEATLTIDSGTPIGPQGISTPAYATNDIRIGFTDDVEGAEKQPFDGQIGNPKLVKNGVTQFDYDMDLDNTTTEIRDVGGLNNHAIAYRFNLNEQFVIPDASGDVLYYDQFGVTEAAPMTTPRTASVGTTVLGGSDAGTDISIPSPGGFLEITASGLNDNRYVRTNDSFARVAGRRLEALIKHVEPDQPICMLMWSSSTDGNSTGANVKCGIQWGNDIPAPTQFKVRTTPGIDQTRLYSSTLHAGQIGPAQSRREQSLYPNEEVFVSLILRENGFHGLFTQAGALKHGFIHNETGTTPLYGTFTTRNSNPTRIGFMRVRESLYLPKPYTSELFNRANSSNLGGTDNLGVEESGGTSRPWSKLGSGTLEIVSTRLRNTSTTNDGIAFVTTPHSDVLIEADIYPGNYGGIAFRVKDANNYMAFVVESTTAEDSDTVEDQLRLIKVVNGTETELDSIAISGTLNPDSLAKILLICDGGSVYGFLDAPTGTNAVAYDAAIVDLEQNTGHGILLSAQNPSGDNSECDRFAIWPRIITDYT